MHAPIAPRWRGVALTAVAAVALAVPATASAAPVPQAEIDAAVSAGVNWIADQQDKLANGNPNPSPTGGLLGMNADWAITTLAAGGIHAADVHKPGVPQSLQSHRNALYLPGGSYNWTALPASGVAGNFGREALIASAAGLRVTKLDANFNLTASLASKWRVDQGDFGGFTPNSDGFALLATQALHLPKGVRQKIVANLLTAQKTGTTPDAQGRTAVGGWSFSSGPNGNGDIDMTGSVLSMLCQEGMTPSHPAVAAGVDFLHRRLNPETGGFGVAAENFIPANNTPSAAWAVIGLKACGIDLQSPAWTTPNDQNPIKFLIGQQRTDPAAPGHVGSLKYVPTSATPAPAHDMNATEAGIRALSNSRWYSAPPERANPSDPRWRPTVDVADGTPVPVALAVDPGNGDVRFCAVEVPAGSPLSAVLEKARTSSVPSGCVSAWGASQGRISTINGEPGTEWTVRLGGGEAQPAADQPVGFGDVVALELRRELTTTAADAAFGTQAETTIGGVRTVSFTASADGIKTGRTVLAGPAADDFVIVRDGCANVTLDAGEHCSVSIRFAPSAVGARTAELRITGTVGGEAISPTITLTGVGSDAPRGPGDVGPEQPPLIIQQLVPTPIPAPTPAPASNGRKTDEPRPRLTCRVRGSSRSQRVVCGERRKAAPVTCKVSGKRKHRVTCTVRTADGQRSTRARLTRKGKTVASGRLGSQRTTLTVRSKQRVGAARYTLRLGDGQTATTFAIRIR